MKAKLTAILLALGAIFGTAHAAIEKVGDVTVNYESAETLRRALPRRMKSVVYSWLADTGLLHRGGDLC